MLLAVCGLHATQLRPNDLDLTLPWDPVNKSANNAVKTDEDMSTESFSQCHDKNADRELSTFTSDKLQKFTLGISFDDGKITCIYKTIHLLCLLFCYVFPIASHLVGVSTYI